MAVRCMTNMRPRSHASSFGPPPPPLGGYFEQKMLVFSWLQTACVGKILRISGLRLKYLFSII
jgi:hypothetical protein